MRKGTLGWAFIILLLGGLWVFLFTRKPAQRQSFRTADGTEWSLVEISYATNYTVVRGNLVERLLYKVLPEKLKHYSGANVIGFPNGDTNVPTFWVHETHVATNRAAVSLARAGWPIIACRMLDEFGCEHEPAGLGTGYSTAPNEGVLWFCRGHLSDPHGQIAGIAVYNSEHKTNEVGRFLIPGCKFKSLPTYSSSENAPKPQRDRDMGFQLISLVTGIRSEAATNSVLFTRARFRITKNGAVLSNWFSRNLQVTDSKGKLVASISNDGRGFEEGDIINDFAGFLDPAAGPYKLRIEFLHLAGFSPDDLATFKDLPVPEHLEILTNNLTANVQGHRVTLEKVYGPGSEVPVHIFDHLLVQATISPETNSIHLFLERAIDENGEEHPCWGAWNMTSNEKGTRYFPFFSDVRAKRLTLTFAVHQSKFVEFEATPIVLSTNATANSKH